MRLVASVATELSVAVPMDGATRGSIVRRQLWMEVNDER
jgi:hypothetical protein